MGESDSRGTAPAGWYEDPMRRHQHRYWDGTCWTHHVANNGEASIDPLDEQSDAGQGASPSSAEQPAALLRELEADTYTRRLKAAEALGKLGDPAALPALERMSNGTDDLWVLFDEGMRARARIAYPSGRIPGTDAETLWSQLGGTNDQLKRAAKAAITQIKESAGTANPKEAAMKVFDDAYLVRDNPELEEAVVKALDSIHASPNGLTTLLDRLCEGVVIAGGRVRLADWGDMTWNELLKKREILRCFGRAKDGRATSKLRELLQAESSYQQWVEIVQPAVARALGDIGTEEAVEALKDTLGRSNVPVDSTRAIQEALATAVPGEASAADSVPDINKRTNTQKVGCVGFALKEPAHGSSLRTRLGAIAATGGGTPARVDAMFELLEAECSIEHPYVYDATFDSAWLQVSGDVVMVVDYENKWDQFAKKMESQHYSGEPALLRAMAVNARALELTVQFLSSVDDVVMTL